MAQDAAKILNDMQQTLQQLKNGTLILYQFETIDENGEPISVLVSADKETMSDSGIDQADDYNIQFKNAVVSTTDANGTLTADATCSTAIAVTTK